MNNYTTGTTAYFFYGLLVPPYPKVVRLDNDIIISWSEIYEPNVSFEIWDIIGSNNPILLGTTIEGANNFTCSVDNTINHKIIVRAKQNDFYSGFCNPIELPVSNYYFAIPVNELFVIVGNELTLQGDELVNFPIGYPCQVTYTCDIGTQTGNNFTVNAIAGDIGVHVLTIKIQVNSLVTEIKTINLSVSALVGVSAAKILMIGDSTLVAPNIDTIAATMEGILINTAFTFLGTQGGVYLNEGRAGYSFQRFLEQLPFFIGGVLDVPQYFIDNAIDIPDIVYIRLGINDMFTYIGHEVTDANINTIISKSDQLINAFLALDPALKIVLGFTTLTGVNSVAWNIDYDENLYIQNNYIQGVHKLQLAFKNRYSGGVYDVRLSCSFESFFINRNTDFLNGVHLNNSGNINLGKALAPYINNLLP